MRRLLSPGWVLMHLAVLVLVTGFLALGWWQVGRAAQGNLLSYGYAVEWPVFAAFVIFVWIMEMRKAVRAGKAPLAERADDAGAESATADDPVPAEPVRTSPRRPRIEAAYDDSNDPDLAAYNHYLAWLNANPHLTPADYPGMNDSTTTTKENR